MFIDVIYIYTIYIYIYIVYIYIYNIYIYTYIYIYIHNIYIYICIYIPYQCSPLKEFIGSQSSAAPWAQIRPFKIGLGGPLAVAMCKGVEFFAVWGWLEFRSSAGFALRVQLEKKCPSQL